MPIAEEFWGSLPPGPALVAASGCKPLSRTALAACLRVVFAASAGMVRTVRRCDPGFEWVSAIVELRPSRNGTRSVVWIPDDAAVAAAADAAAVVAAVVAAAAVAVEPGGDVDDDGAGVDVDSCAEEPRSPGLETDSFAAEDGGRCSVSVWVPAERMPVSVE